jgi:NADH:ubiquinone oxidoreductase subunit 2 (subunit N)
MLKFIWVILGARVLISVRGSLNQLNTKKLLAYSSIFRAVWILRCGPVFDVLIQYLGAYRVALVILARLFSLENCANVNEFLYQAEKRRVILLIIGFFRIGGSPPFLGFYAKIIVAQVLLSQAQIILLSFIVIRSVFLLYVYMRFFYFSISGLRAASEQGTAINRKLGVLRVAIFFLLGLP